MRLWDDEIEAMRPEARAAVAAGFDLVMEMVGAPERIPDDPIERAELVRAQFARTYAPSPDGIDREIAGVPCRVFLPEGVPTAIYLHFHGGGMILGAPVMNDLGNADLAKRFGVAVVSVDYRLAPEHPYPAGPDDCMAVAAWVLEHGASELGASRVVIGGESAGGYLAALVPLRIRDELGGIERIAGVNLVFGVHDWGRSPSQRGLRGHDGPDLLDPEGISFFGDAYLPGLTDDERRDPAISPAYADLRGMPPALMSVGTTDHLVDDTLMLAARWAAAGNEVELFVAPDMPHGFMAFPCGITDRWLERTHAWLAGVLAGWHAQPGRTQQELAMTQLMDMWDRSILNLYASPLRQSEYVTGAIIFSFFLVVIGSVLLAVFVGVAFDFNILDVGALLVPAFLILLGFGWALGLFIRSCVLRFGSNAEVLAWSLALLLQPVAAVFYPISSLPDWLQPIAQVVPVSHVFEAMRAFLADGDILWGQLALGAVLDVVYLAVGAAVLRFAYRSVRNRGLLSRPGH